MPQLIEFDAARLHIGQELPWNLYDSRGCLLLRAGATIVSESALNKLISRGLHIDAVDAPPPPPAREEPPPPRTAASLILDARKGLAALLAAPPADGLRDRVLELVALVREAVEMNRDLALAMIMMRREDAYASRHAVDCATVCAVIGPAMGLSEADVASVMAAALTMNIAMMELQDVLFDQREQPSADQRALIRAHPEAGAALLREHGVSDRLWLDCVLNHHEAADGSGYPRGVKEAELAPEIQLLALALADVYCARISDRRYRRALRPNAVLRSILLNERLPIGGSLGPLFIKVIGVYPPGTLVKLRNGDLAAVMQRGEKPLAPLVYAFTDGRGKPISPAVRRDTNAPGAAIADVLDWSQADRPISVLAVWGVEGDASA